MEGDEHEGDTDEEIVVDSAPVPVQARAPKVIEISNEEQEEEEPEERQAEEEQDEEEQAEEAEELKQGGGGDPGDHLDPEGSDPKEEDPDDQDAEPEKLSVVVYHHDGGYARFPSMTRRLSPPQPSCEDRLHGAKEDTPLQYEKWKVSVHILDTDPYIGGG
jgi:hypothetical protein